MLKHWTPAQLGTLRRIRERFLEGTAGEKDYWRSPEDLALYDATFAERIGWKWDAVLDELARRGWQPKAKRILDWGCGSGIAHRRILAAWPQFETLALHDRSALARDFAAKQAREKFPNVQVSAGAPKADADTLLLVSHVISELPPAELDRLLVLAREAGEVIWVEAGTHVDSRRLIAVRERLRDVFSAVAPCTHQQSCGMLAAENAAHWCHHFSRPPSAIFQDAGWMEFGREMGIDLRSLPYSFLVLTKHPAPMPDGYSRVIGDPREAKGFMRVLSCQASGVADLILQKRDDPGLFKAMQKERSEPIYRWKMENGKIVEAEPWSEAWD